MTVGTNALPWNAAWDAEVESECFDALTTATAITTANVKLDVLTTALASAIVVMTGVSSAVTTIDGIVDIMEMILRNKMEVIDSDGTVTLYLADSATTAYCVTTCVTDDATTTTRKRLA